MEEMETKLAQAQEKTNAFQTEKDALTSLLSTANAALASSEEDLEKLLNLRSLSLQKREGARRKIRALGTLPAQEDELTPQSSKKLLKEIKKVSLGLKKYSHVNKKALDQFVNFSDQREALLKRKTEADEGAVAIEELIEHLDQKKDEAIQRTFKGVAKHFREVFKELVPQGHAELHMISSQTRAESESEAASADSFVGVSPRVCFTQKGDVARMNQLSGGQKALVALTLVFAIQRADPAPFYLFDEIDQALDASHRTSKWRIYFEDSCIVFQ